MADGVCLIDDCEKPKAVRGMCHKHYARWQRHGDPLKAKQPFGAPGERFWRFVRKGASCWEWAGYINPKGYGRFPGATNGKSYQAHRFSYELHKGSIPDGLVVMHTCDNRRCVNPDHLEVGTAKENTHDMLRKGRGRWVNKRGSENPRAALTEQDVRQIKASTESGVSLARKFGVGPSAICAVRRGRTWAHVT